MPGLPTFWLARPAADFLLAKLLIDSTIELLPAGATKKFGHVA
jgi:hypothetical protein